MTAKTNAERAREIVTDWNGHGLVEPSFVILAGLIQSALDEKDAAILRLDGKQLPGRLLTKQVVAEAFRAVIEYGPSMEGAMVEDLLQRLGFDDDEPTPAITKSNWEKTENIGNQCAGPEDIEPGVRKQLGKPTPASPTQATCACAEASIADCPVHCGLQDEATSEAEIEREAVEFADNMMRSRGVPHRNDLKDAYASGRLYGYKAGYRAARARGGQFPSEEQIRRAADDTLANEKGEVSSREYHGFLAGVAWLRTRLLGEEGK